MTTNEVIKFYGGLTKAAGAIGVSEQTLRNWKITNKVPSHSQLAIQVLSRGKLKADKSCF